MKPSEPVPSVDSITSNCYLESRALTLSGCRNKHSEDSTLDLCEYGIFCVADGMGGNTSGKMASESVIEVIREQCWDTKHETEKKLIAVLEEAVSRAKIRIQRHARANDLEGVGATVALLHLNPVTNSAFVMHAGDSRVYRFRNKALTQLTQDHSVTDELGLPQENDVSHIIQGKLTRAVGLFDRVNLEINSVEMLPRDVFLVCSSGLPKTIKDPQIVEILTKSLRNGVESAANQLVAEAEKQASEEDVSMVLVKVVSETAGGANLPNKTMLAILGGLISATLIICAAFFFRNNTSKGISEKNNIEPGVVAVASDAENRPGGSAANGGSIATKDTNLSIDFSNPGQKRPDGQNSIEPRKVPGAPEINEGQPEKSQTEILEDPAEGESNKTLQQRRNIGLQMANTLSPNDAETTNDRQPPSVAESRQLSVVISNPDVGTTRLLVEKYSDGRQETSTLSDQEYLDRAQEVRISKPEVQIGAPQDSKIGLESSSQAPQLPESSISYPAKTGSEYAEEAQPASRNISKRVQTKAVTLEPQRGFEDQKQVSRESDEISSIFEDLTQTLTEWDTLGVDEKEQSRTLILQKLNVVIDKTREINYQNGNELWNISQQISDVDDPRLNKKVNKLLLDAEADFARYLKGVVTQMTETCNWPEVNAILNQNSKMNSELQNLSLIKFARAWCQLTTEVETEPENLKTFMNRLTKLTSRIRLLMPKSDGAELVSQASEKSETFSPAERCHQIRRVKDSLHSSLWRGIKRLTLNLNIIDRRNLQSLVDFTYPGGSQPKSYEKKLAFVDSGLDQLKKIEDSLATKALWQLPESKLAQLEESTQKVLVLFYRIQHHLRFIQDLLQDYQRVSMGSGEALLKDFSLSNYYMAKYEKIKEIFSSSEARELTQRFSSSFKSEEEE